MSALSSECIHTTTPLSQIVIGIVTKTHKNYKILMDKNGTATLLNSTYII